MRLTVTNYSGDQSETSEFEIEFVEKCRLVELIEPRFA